MTGKRLEEQEKKIRIGIIGVGKMGTYHANVLSTMDDEIEFIGVYDIDEERAQNISDKYKIRAYETMEDLLDHADGVCVAVPTGIHYDIAKKTLDAGVHTLVEKPISRTIEEATDLVKTAADNKLVFQVGHIERFKGAVTELKKIVSDPYLVEARRIGPWKEKDWDTGVVLDLMIHDIDIVLSLINSDVVYIDSMGTRVKSNYEDIASAVLQFENGTIATITSSRLSETRVRTMSISQDRAYIVLDFEANDINIYRGSSARFFVSPVEITYTHDSFVERVLVQKENALKDELQHFIDCIYGRTEPIVSGEDDIKTLDITLKIIHRIEKKRKSSAELYNASPKNRL
jgi:predicted dehydrogenase